MSPLLTTTELSVRFGGVCANDRLTLAVEGGQLVGLIGANGAGKTTFIDAVTGFVKSRGRIDFNGCDITDYPAHRRAHVGLGRTWQSVELFDDLTVAENVAVAAEKQTAVSFLADLVRPRRPRNHEALSSALEMLGLADVAGRMLPELTQGQRKLVGIARALATSPRLVCMDEPAAGLDAEESRRLGIRLRNTVRSGVGILLVDHDMGLVLTVCDYIYVLEFGSLIAQGTPSEIRADERVIASYLGTPPEASV